MCEIWKDILGYEGLYQVSNFGRIKNLERKVRCKGNNLKIVKERIRKPQVKKNGYHIATLCDGKGGTKTFSVHQLVAIAFIPNFTKGTELNHIDGNPSNNCLDNLELSNPSHNQFHAWRLGLNNRVKPQSSKYKGVTYIKSPKAVKRWAGYITHEGKSCYGWKTFDTELEAATHVNMLLDSIQDTQRLRNFPTQPLKCPTTIPQGSTP